jgi:nitroreductase
VTINQLIQERYGVSTETGHSAEGNETVSKILSRRSHRSFSRELVPPDLLDTLFAVAFSAPSKSDLQQACVIHIDDKGKQKRIADLSPSTKWVSEAPVFLVWCGDNRRIRKLSDWREHDFANDHLDAFMNSAVDAGICMQTFIIAAESYGLGCCPISEVRNSIEPLSEELNLPEYVFPVAGLCVGWPDTDSQLSLRLPQSVTVKTNSYSDSRLISDIDDYDARREAIEKTPPEKQKYKDQFGISDNYGWSEARTRQYSIPAREDFGRYIRKQGFNLS